MSLLLSTPHGEDPLTSTHLHHLHHHHHHTTSTITIITTTTSSSPPPSSPLPHHRSTLLSTFTKPTRHQHTNNHPPHSSSSSSSSSHLSRPWKTSSHARISWQSVTENGEQWHRTHVAPFSWIERRKPVLSSRHPSKSCLYFTFSILVRVTFNFDRISKGRSPFSRREKKREK